MTKKVNILTKKAMTYIGIIVMSVLAFYAAAFAIVWISDVVYYNTSLLDGIYMTDGLEYIQVAFAAIMMNRAYESLKHKCFAK